MGKGKGIPRCRRYCRMCKQHFWACREDADTCSQRCRKAKNRLLGGPPIGNEAIDMDPVHFSVPADVSGNPGPWAYCGDPKSRRLTDRLEEVTCLECVQSLNELPLAAVNELLAGSQSDEPQIVEIERPGVG